MLFYLKNIIMNIKTLFLLPSLLLLVLILNSCQKAVLDPKSTTSTSNSNSSVQTSFSAEIVPIFTANCISCHNPGAVDLREAGAYNALITNASPYNKYVDTLNPASSLLYQKLTMSNPPTGGMMPPSGLLPSSTTDLVLKWIQEGAKNN